MQIKDSLKISAWFLRVHIVDSDPCDTILQESKHFLNKKTKFYHSGDKISLWGAQRFFWHLRKNGIQKLSKI